MGKSLPYFFAKRGRNRCRNLVFFIFDVFFHSEDICGQSLKMSAISPNFHVLGLFLRTSKFLHMHYKGQSKYGHVAKFYDDRPMELVDLALDKKTFAD